MLSCQMYAQPVLVFQNNIETDTLKNISDELGLIYWICLLDFAICQTIKFINVVWKLHF